MSERRYDDAEVTAILARASELPSSASPPSAAGNGLTLAQLQEIGREVGIAPEAIAQAARGLVHGTPHVARRYLGLPLTVTHTVALGRRITDAEWEQLVVQFRDTFDARGKTVVQGGLRQWTNGNLQALVEPTPSGDRLRLRTTKGDARTAVGGGLAIMGISSVGLLVSLLPAAAGAPALDAMFGALSVFGAGMAALSAWRLPRWAETRRQQMQGIAERLTAEPPSATPLLPPEEP